MFDHCIEREILGNIFSSHSQPIDRDTSHAVRGVWSKAVRIIREVCLAKHKLEAATFQVARQACSNVRTVLVTPEAILRTHDQGTRSCTYSRMNNYERNLELLKKRDITMMMSSCSSPDAPALLYPNSLRKLCKKAPDTARRGRTPLEIECIILTRSLSPSHLYKYIPIVCILHANPEFLIRRRQARQPQQLSDHPAVLTSSLLISETPAPGAGSSRPYLGARRQRGTVRSQL